MRIAIDGMHCQACVQRVRKALEKVEGIRLEKVDVASATVTADPKQQEAVLEAIRRAGYAARPSE